MSKKCRLPEDEKRLPSRRIRRTYQNPEGVICADILETVKAERRDEEDDNER